MTLKNSVGVSARASVSDSVWKSTRDAVHLYAHNYIYKSVWEPVYIAVFETRYAADLTINEQLDA
jgi:hypothetical protein